MMIKYPFIQLFSNINDRQGATLSCGFAVPEKGVPLSVEPKRM